MYLNTLNLNSKSKKFHICIEINITNMGYNEPTIIILYYHILFGLNL